MGQGSPGIITNQKREVVAGPPFAAGAANNGLSVDPVSGKIVWGENAIGGGGVAALLSNRVISFGNFNMAFKSDGGQTTTQFLKGKLLIFGNFGATGTAILMELQDGAVGRNETQVNTANAAIQRSALGDPGGGPGDFLDHFVPTGNFRITNTVDDADNGRLLQVNGNMSLGTDVTFNLDFPNTPAQSSSDLSSALFIGALVGDFVQMGIDPASVMPNSCYTAWVSAPDTVTVRFNNYSAGAQNPPVGSFKISVIKAA